jgi:glycosyltransferase involved in cell wall biosynthesis
VTGGELRALGIERVMVWGRGVDAGWFRPDRRSETRRAGLGAQGRLLVLHVGRLAVEKDVDTLVAALISARERLGDRAAFCVAGDGPRAAWVRQMLPFAAHLGFLDRERLAQLYADADLFVFPSPTETCGLVALEAMASGLPVIASDRGGVRDNLRHGLTGLVVPAGDAAGFAAAMVALADDPEQRRAMGEAARAFGVGRDWGRELDRLEESYSSLAPASSPAAAPSAWPTTTSVT